MHFKSTLSHPFYSLESTGNQNNFQFWWDINEVGTIHVCFLCYTLSHFLSLNVCDFRFLCLVHITFLSLFLLTSCWLLILWEWQSDGRVIPPHLALLVSHTWFAFSTPLQCRVYGSTPATWVGDPEVGVVSYLRAWHTAVVQ